MLDSVDGLTTKLSDYASEEGAPLLQPAQHANRVWKEVEKGASRALEHQYTQKVLTPVVNYIGELEGLKKLYEGPRPPKYQPMKKEGAIILGVGGDSSDWAIGTFYEGVMTTGYASDATDAAVHANIVAAGYGA